MGRVEQTSFLAQSLNRPRSGPNRHPTLDTSMPATCSSVCVNGRRVCCACPPCRARVLTIRRALLPSPRAIERPSQSQSTLPTPSTHPHSLCLCPGSSLLQNGHADSQPPWAPVLLHCSFLQRRSEACGSACAQAHSRRSPASCCRQLAMAA